MCTGVCHYSGWVHVTEDLICVGFFLFYFSCILIAHAFDGGKQTRSMVADFGTFCSPSLLERNIKQDKGLKRPESITCMRISACPLIIHTNDFLFKKRPKRQRAKKNTKARARAKNDHLQIELLFLYSSSISFLRFLLQTYIHIQNSLVHIE